ncbi:hypothetical protein QJQ45_011363 [Haematococcus lacustris]|nr:hypothetical protein QJQ45_011363 [Haematococcus lacustris]
MTVGPDPSNADELCTKLKEAVAPTVAKSAALQTFCNEHTLENSKDTDRQIKFLIYHLEIASRMADKLGVLQELLTQPQPMQCTAETLAMQLPVVGLLTHLAGCTGVGKMCWLLDFQGYTLANAPPIRVSLTCNSILQNHYPERLGQAICYHAPTLFSMTWKAVRPFVDVVTQQKILFVDKGATGEELMASHLHMEHMEECMGGRRPGLAFDLAEYEQRMLAFDKEVEDELAAAAAALGSLGASQPNSSQADLQVNVQEPVVPALKAGHLDNAAEAAEAAPPRS